MVKKLKWASLLIAFILIFAFIASGIKVNFVYANSGYDVDYEKSELDLQFSFEEYEDGYYISAYKGNSYYLEIPDYYNGKKVIGIKDNVAYKANGEPYSVKGVFANQDFIHINFGKNLNYIGSSAFEGCNGLQEVIIPENVKRIHHKAFYNCTNLKSIDLPKLEYLGNAVFGETAWLNAKSNANIEEFISQNGGVFNTKEDYHFDNVIYYEEQDNLMLLSVYNLKNRQEYIVKEGTRLIASQVFKYSLPISSITIPTSVEHIGSALLGPPPYNVTETDVKLDYLGCNIIVKKNGQNISQAERNEYFKNLGLEEYTFAKVKIDGVLATYPSTIPSVYIVANTVGQITKRAFYNQKSLTEMVIPSSVKYIGVEAFKGCTNLEKITFESGGAVVIDSNAFSGCTKLFTIDGAENIALIGSGAFKGCNKLNDITLGNVTIKSNAFYGCSNLLNITQKTGTQIREIGYNAFLGTGVINTQDVNGFSLVGDFIIKYHAKQSSLNIDKNIADFAFSNSTVQNVTISQDKIIGKGAFFGAGSLNSVTINSNAIPELCFYNCSNLSIINGSPTDIGSYAFAETNLGGIDLTNTTTIGSNAFKNSSLTSLDIKNAQLEDYALFGTNILAEISASGSQNYVVNQGVLFSKDLQKIVCYPAKLNLAILNLTNVIIGKGAFSNCDSGVELMGTIIEIEDRAFEGANVIFSATGTKKVGYKSFYDSKITSLAFTELESVQEKAFCYSKDLQSLNLTTSSILPIGILKGCENLTDLTVSLNRVGNSDYKMQLGYLFGLDYCQNSEVVYQNYKQGNKLKYYIPKLENVTVSGNVGYGAFMGLTHLKNANLKNVNSLGAYAFAGCSKLEKVTLNQNVNAIPIYAFYGCSSLKGFNADNIVDLGGITLIGDNAFNGCKEITQVEVKQGLFADKIYSGAFANCTKLQNVNVYSLDFFNKDNNYTIYGNLFDNATQVYVGLEALTSEQISSLNTFHIVQKEKNIKTFIQDNKTLLICIFFIVLAVLIAILVPIVRARQNAKKTVDEFGRPIAKHRHHNHHHHRH